MGNRPEKEKRRFAVFGAQDTGDKSVLAYKDARSGIFAVITFAVVVYIAERVYTEFVEKEKHEEV